MYINFIRIELANRELEEKMDNEHMFEEEMEQNNNDSNMYGENQTTSDEQTHTEDTSYGETQQEHAENPYGNPYGNPYENPYGGNGYQYNPYGGAPREPQRGPHGKKMNVGLGIASLVIGIISLMCFCTGLNVILAILAIVFGIVQLATCESKGLAIGGIVMAAISIVLTAITYGLLFSNVTFTDMMKEEVQQNFQDDEDIQQFLEEYGVTMDGEDTL